ncbi:ATP-dependent DNA helicase [Trichonephila clavipes]|nr:ATP-dependent DNA helicase [Trichonephila clavipes]
MPMRKRRSLGRKTVKSKAVEHTRAAEAPDEKRARLQADQVRHSLARAAETPEQYQVRLQSHQVHQKASRATETPEQWQSRLHDDQVCRRVGRATETPEQKQSRLQEDQVHHRAARAAETPNQHVVHLLGLRKQRNVSITLKWKAQNHDGFMYNPRYDYESNNLLDIGRMSNVCFKCSALKWKGETPGMCCSNGKIKLPPILKPPEPLCSLLKGEIAQSKDFVQGQVYHHDGPLHPANTENRKYLQIYFLGEDEQVQRRLNLLDSPVDRNIVLKLQRMLHQHNSYVRSFKMTAEVMDENTQVDYRIKISVKAPLKEHKGRFNAPSVSEVAIMIAGELGEDGYDLKINDVNKATSNAYYAYRMMQRVNGFNTLLRCPRLFQQYIVDMYAKAVRNDNNVTSENLVKLVVLPSSFTRGPRYMLEYAEDGMTYVRHRGTPDLFITFTCNPSWPEIAVELLPGRVEADRVDLVARVFQQEVKKMMHVFKDVQVFGKVVCLIYSIEWQKIFKAHINAEYCNSVKSIKYICKYVTKGSDAAMFPVANEMSNRLDEVTTYQQGRYISSRGYEPGQPTAHLTDTPPKTTLTAFFYLCKTDPLAKTLLYSEVPRHFHCDASQKFWQIRKKGVPLADFPGYVTDNVLVRMYTVHPNNREAFHMRLLLHHVRGPISFQHLKTFVVRDEDGDILEIKPCSTYTEACQVLGLVEDDSHWYQAMEEAAVSQSPTQLRNLFAILIAVCGLNKPITLWENHKEDMTEDFLHQTRRNNPSENIEYCDALFNNSLLILEDKILSITGNKLALYGLPEPVHDQSELTSKDVLSETSYDVRACMAANVPKLTPDQQQAVIAITRMIGSERGGIVFLDAPGGTGKTFLLNLLLAFVRKEKDMAVAVASSGIAATLLAGGRTARSAFKLPLDLAKSNSATCNISKGTGQGHVLKTCKLIVWNEATISHRNAFHAFDKTLQDLRGSSAIMGGATVVLAGDFRQTLPNFTRSTPADQINDCLKNSYL